jgi:SAM-dependent methyltransferase
MRYRALVATLAVELFGAPLKLYELPVLKSIRGLGLSDAESYGRVLGDRFDYRNTYFDRPPQLDITAPAPDLGTFDFLIASEVFEHVRQPVEQAFRNALDLLRPNGVLVITVPYELQGGTAEHYPDLCDFTVVTLRGETILVNRTAAGAWQVFPDPVFHGGRGSTLEMRLFSESGLRQSLADAGFEYLRIHAEDYPDIGIVHEELCSLPVAARRRAPDGGRGFEGEFFDRYRELHEELLRANAAIRVEQEENRRLHDELTLRTEWARGLEYDLKSELEKRTAWARGLEAELEERTTHVQQLDRDVKELEQHLQRLQGTKWHRLGKLLRPTAW